MSQFWIHPSIVLGKNHACGRASSQLRTPENIDNCYTSDLLASISKNAKTESDWSQLQSAHVHTANWSNKTVWPDKQVCNC